MQRILKTGDQAIADQKTHDIEGEAVDGSDEQPG